MSPLSIESGEVTNLKQTYIAASAHVIGKDSWQQVGLMLVTSFNCAYILSFSNLLMVPLGWTLGPPCLAIVGVFSFYANWLLAGFHIIDDQRFIRYRDIMGYIFGRRMYYLTWILQFFTLILGNMGFILLGGRALKEINLEFSEYPLRLQVFIFVTGLVYFLFAYIVPNMSAMRPWLAISAVLTTTYVVTLLVLVVKAGKENKKRDYNLKGGDVDKVFNVLGGIAANIVSSNSGFLPEIQSTIRKPVVTNMRKAVASQFLFGILVYYAVTVVGYWAFGASVSEYLPRHLNAPKWAVILINLSAFLQNIISQHMFLVPVHEALDTKFLKLDEDLSSPNNLVRRFFLRVALLGINTLISSVLPFMGDFVNLLGSFTLVTLTFIFPSMIFIKVKGRTAKTKAKVWHWSILIVSSMLSLATTISAVRLIVNNARKYQFFANT